MIIAKTVLALAGAAAMSFAAGDAKAGADAYAKACKSCHGADGTPNPAIAKMMKVEMRHLGDPAVQSLPDSKWEEIITNGNGKMKPVKSVTSVADVVAFGKTLKK